MPLYGGTVLRGLTGSSETPHNQGGRTIFVLIRAVTYAAVFIGFVLIFLPARVLEWSGVGAPPRIGGVQVVGALMTLAGGALVISCVLAFAFIGRGTPAPFDPPRRLVVRGPYRWVRNPMYIGAALALAGAAVFYQSLALAGFVAAFLVATILFVWLYEEPVLRRMFGADYDAYCARVGRWWPRRPE